MSLSLLVVLALGGVWCLVIGEFSLGQILLGLLFGSLFVLLTGLGSGRRVSPSRLPSRLVYLGIYLLLLIPYDIVRSNLDLAQRLLHRNPRIQPGIVRLRLGEVPETVSALVAHAITMSPGEMVVDYSEDGRTLYVHLIDATDVEQKRGSFWQLYHRVLRRVFS